MYDPLLLERIIYAFKVFPDHSAYCGMAPNAKRVGDSALLYLGLKSFSAGLEQCEEAGLTYPKWDTREDIEAIRLASGSEILGLIFVFDDIFENINFLILLSFLLVFLNFH